MRCSISHVDTCLSCYVPDHRWIGVPITSHTTYQEALDALSDEWAQDGMHDGEDVTEDTVKAFEAEIAALKIQHAARLSDPLVPSIEDSDDEDAESVYAWFTVTFEGA